MFTFGRIYRWNGWTFSLCFTLAAINLAIIWNVLWFMTILGFCWLNW